VSAPAAAPPTRRGGPAWAGAVLPGLGHVLGGRPGLGAILLGYVVVLALTVRMAAPRLSSLLFPPPVEGRGSLHAWIAAGTALALAAVLWGFAIRFAARGDVRLRRHLRTQAQLAWSQFLRHRLGVVGLHCVLVLGLVTLLAPFLAPFDPGRIDVGPKLAAPGLGHLLGTDEFGRDLLSRLLFGARVSLSIGFLAVGISATFGALWGATSGYLGGRIDTVMAWLVDLLLSLPRLVLVITIVGLFRPSGATGLYLVVLVLGLTGWMGVSRIVRGMVLSLKEQEFIQASRAMGQSTPLIIVRHLLPNALAPVIVHATLGVGLTILTEATLSFLGLGVPPPTATWGSIVNDGREFLRSAWWITTFPGLLIVFAVMSFNLLGDGLRDALDPRLRRG
jgi:peptide/nickel transport system permease protein